MMPTKLLLCTALVALLPTFSSTAEAQPASDRPLIHPLFSDHAVLQRDQRLPIWGWTAPGAQVTVSLAGKSRSTVADQDGRWEVKLGPFRAGGPHELIVDGPQHLTLTDILVGDVWLCSGQSNMEWPVAATRDAEQEIAASNYPHVRLFTVPKRVSFAPESLVDAQWQPCSSATVGPFSAVGYFFGRDLHLELGVPIGLIHSSWGGTVAEAWTSRERLAPLGDFATQLDGLAKVQEAVSRGEQDQLLSQWYASNDPGTAEVWQRFDLTNDGWKAVQLPAEFEKIGLPSFDGIAWFRRTFEVPEDWAAHEAVINLGPIDDIDTTWLNGAPIGHREQWNEPRSYRVPAGALRPGLNVIAIRILDTGGDGGLVGTPAQLKVYPVDRDSAAISLAGNWQMRSTTDYHKVQPAPISAGQNPNQCTVLYNGMIAPLVPAALRGAIWYQGESNADRADQYRRLLPAMIHDWRDRFTGRHIGFHIVSLANFQNTSPIPVDHPWARLREAQAITAQTLSDCGLALAIDIGEANDIHPRNKQEVGRRLALSALGVTYRRPLNWSGPWYRSMKATPHGLRLRFNHVADGLKAHGEKLQGFTIAGEDRKFVWAEAKIDGRTVVVSSPDVPQPVAVRYDWDVNPTGNLYNTTGLPAVPFRTDSWD